MVEVVFGASACGSLRQAQHYGKGPWHKPAIGAVLRSDGQPPTKEELRAVQRRAEERSRREWEEAVPLALGGNTEDIYCLELALSMGDISEEMPGPLRQQALEKLIRGASPAEEARRQTQRLWEKSQEALRAITARSTAGETVRVWYSQQPDELCGMCFLLERLESAGTTGPVSLVELPQWEERPDGTLVHRISWGEVGPGEWGRLAAAAYTPSPARRRFFANCWRELRRKNAPLRAVVNGQLMGVPADFYDGLIRWEIAAADREFRQAHVIGQVLGRRPRIGDAWVALRMEEMIRAGLLEVVSQVPPEDLVYRRILRRTEAFDRLYAGESGR